MPYIFDLLGIHEGTMTRFHQSNDYQVTEQYEDEMELLQYDILYGERYAYGGEDLYPASDLEMGVEDIVLSSFVPNGDTLYVMGDNFTPWSRVFVNDKKVSTTFISSTQLQIKMSALEEGDNSIVVNQMGSSNTKFRSSNEEVFHKITVENLSE